MFLGYSVTFDIEENASYNFLNELRSTHDGDSVDAHITVVPFVKAAPADTMVLQNLLAIVANRMSPFNLSFDEVKLLQRSPNSRYCITIPVKGRCLHKIRSELYLRYVSGLLR
jgi:hypothetical protein